MSDLRRIHSHQDWEREVSSAVQTLETATRTMEQRPNKIIEFGRQILRALSNQSKEHEAAHQERLSAALMVVETFLARPKEVPPLPDLFSKATQTLSRFQEVYSKNAGANAWKKRLHTELESSPSQQQAVDHRIAHLRPQGVMVQEVMARPFFIRHLTPCNATTQEVDALRIKAGSLYRRRYETTPLETLSIVQSAPVFSVLKEQEVHLHTVLTHPARGERAIAEGTFQRVSKGGSRSVPQPNSFHLHVELHYEFPLCVQSCGFAWALPERLFPNCPVWTHLSEEKQRQLASFSKEDLLMFNEQLIHLKSRLFQGHGKELIGLVEELVSAIAFKVEASHAIWRPTTREFFSVLSEKADPFIFLSTVHQRIQTVMITRSVQRLEEDRQRTFATFNATEQECKAQLRDKMAHHQKIELDSLTKGLDRPTHSYVSMLSNVLSPRIHSTLLEDGHSDWQQLLQRHCLLQARQFNEQLKELSLPSEEVYKDQLMQQIHEQIALWT